MAKFVLALDQGTTSSRAIVFDQRGRIITTAQKEFRQIFSQPGWVEHDAAEIWSTQLECAQSALRQAGASKGDVAAIGVTNQRETTVIWDRTNGAPIANAIVWQDRRTAERCQALRAEVSRPTLLQQPDCCSIRTSPQPRSSGCSTTCRALVREPLAVIWRSARSIPG